MMIGGSRCPGQYTSTSRLEQNITEGAIVDNTLFAALFQVFEFHFSELGMVSGHVILQDFLRNKLVSTIYVSAHEFQITFIYFHNEKGLIFFVNLFV